MLPQTEQVNKFFHRGQRRIDMHFSVNLSIPVKGANSLEPVKGDYNSEYRGVNHSAFFSDFKLLESCTAFRYFQHLLGETRIKSRVIFTQHTQKKTGGISMPFSYVDKQIKSIKIWADVGGGGS